MSKILVINTNKLSNHSDKILGNWVATPVGIISQLPNYGLYQFDTKIGTPMKDWNMDAIFIEMEDNHDVILTNAAKRYIKKFVNN